MLPGRSVESSTQSTKSLWVPGVPAARRTLPARDVRRVTRTRSTAEGPRLVPLRPASTTILRGDERELLRPLIAACHFEPACTTEDEFLGCGPTTETHHNPPPPPIVRDDSPPVLSSPVDPHPPGCGTFDLHFDLRFDLHSVRGTEPFPLRLARSSRATTSLARARRCVSSRAPVAHSRHLRRRSSHPCS
jgi:hypothetical protein